MNSQDYPVPEAFRPNLGKRNEGGWEHASTSRDAEFLHALVGFAQDCGADQWVRPYMSIKCSDSRDMKESGVGLCFPVFRATPTGTPAGTWNAVEALCI